MKILTLTLALTLFASSSFAGTTTYGDWVVGSTIDDFTDKKRTYMMVLGENNGKAFSFTNINKDGKNVTEFVCILNEVSFSPILKIRIDDNKTITVKDLDIGTYTSSWNVYTTLSFPSIAKMTKQGKAGTTMKVAVYEGSNRISDTYTVSLRGFTASSLRLTQANIDN